MVSYPKISVITPSFNQGQFIEGTIKSVLNQNYPNLEYIIIDGGSTDSSVDIIKKYQENLTWWVSEEDSGQADAINKGLRGSTGDIVCWLNSDDQLYDGTLLKVADYFMQNPDRHIVCGDCLLTFENSTRTVVKKPGQVTLEILHYTYPIQQPSTFWTRTALNSVGYLDESLHYTLDWDYFFRMLEKFDAGYIPEVLSIYHRHAAHKTGSGSAERDQEILDWSRKHSPSEWLCVFEFMYEKAKWVRLIRKVFRGTMAPWVLKVIYLEKLSGTPVERIRTAMKMF